jgi:hypothetical protein
MHALPEEVFGMRVSIHERRASTTRVVVHLDLSSSSCLLAHIYWANEYLKEHQERFQRDRALRRRTVIDL